MSAQEYIHQYGANLTESEKRYILAFGPPPGFTPGPSRAPSTPGLRIRAAETLERTRAEIERQERFEAADIINREAQDLMDEEEAAAFGELE